MDQHTENRIDHIQWESNGTGVVILDQSRLPLHEEYLVLHHREEMFHAISSLQVRGAPAIGIFAAFALASLSHDYPAGSGEAFLAKLQEDADYLISSRPTAVNLAWAARRMVDYCRGKADLPAEELPQLLREEADRILEEDIAMCTAISEYGLSLLHDGDGILTHCNAGPIATSKYGTALGPILLGKERGLEFHVFADETRPLLQGARLTSWELNRAGVDVTLICDNMASMVMKEGRVQFCFVGCDRVAANGDTANKIGTSGVAILAKHYGIPFYVLGPSSTIDLATASGAEIPIEFRREDEIREMWYREPMAPPEVSCFNPAFDVTDHELITGIITEKGICRPPYPESLAAIF